MATRLKEVYDTEIKSAMMEQFGYSNVHQVPKLEKIVLNMGVGDATEDRKRVEGAIEDLTRITGQKPVATRAKKSIAGFKLREGMVIGAKVTLRKDRMYEFLDRLVNIALPRVRDFRGIQGKCFDGHGNFAMGLKEQIVFPPKEGQTTQNHSLQNFLRLIDYHVPTDYSVGVVATALGLVRTEIQSTTEATLSDEAAHAWEQAVMHNLHDCLGLRELMIRCGTDKPRVPEKDQSAIDELKRLLGGS